ncbi:acetyltransferase [Corallococcus sp. CA049B]|uniref:acyltransferase n=1 Tax=Corallococcus sp. CA049B TaxID=2316730 RepID=UPI000EA2F46B|nr:DapH/DapD/GlmU-related protein [Corallococcus sp. CA049B]NOJ91687.1 acetyltransferase [Corallococcus coralloides]RKG91408.1 acetyltransferase [Corallococcus sp. CA049B]
MRVPLMMMLGLGPAVARLKLRRCEAVGATPTVWGRVWIHGEGEIQVGNRVLFDARMAPIELHAQRGGRIVIEDDVTIEGGSSIEAQSCVTLGARSHLGMWCKLMDNMYHPVRGNRHERPRSVPLVVEEGVTVGSRTILLPGAHLQKGASVASGTVISRRIPPGVTVGGSPARVLRREVAR